MFVYEHKMNDILGLLLEYLDWSTQISMMMSCKLLSTKLKSLSNRDILSYIQAGKMRSYCFFTTQAACDGNLQLLQWRIENDFEVDINIDSDAIKAGHTETILWLIEQDYCTLYSIDAAAASGNIPVIEALIAKGIVPTLSTTLYASTAGQLKTLQWLHERKHPLDPLMCFRRVSMHHENIQVAQWLYDNYTLPSMVFHEVKGTATGRGMLNKLRHK